MKIGKRVRRDAKRIYRLCLSGGILDEARVRTAVKLIAESARRERFALLTQFRRFVHLDVERHTAVIESVAPLPADLLATLQSDLARNYGPGLNITVAETTGLIAGMRIKVGSDVYDDSVQARLAALQSHF